jgi:hypothetical protein
MTDAQKRAKEKYNAKILKKVLLEFYPGDQELLDHLEKQPAKQTYIKDLIRKDLNK